MQVGYLKVRLGFWETPFMVGNFNEKLNWGGVGLGRGEIAKFYFYRTLSMYVQKPIVLLLLRKITHPCASI